MNHEEHIGVGVWVFVCVCVWGNGWGAPLKFGKLLLICTCEKKWLIKKLMIVQSTNCAGPHVLPFFEHLVYVCNDIFMKLV